MKSDELRALQAPVKERYRAHPEEALLVLRASGRLGAGVTCRVDTAKGAALAGLHPATGGDGASLCSGEMLLEALVGCAGVTLNAVATSLGVALTDATVEAEGDLDFRGTMAVARDVPVGFKAIRLTFHLQSDAAEEQLAKLIELTERYCVVFQTLKAPPAISVSRQARAQGTDR